MVVAGVVALGTGGGELLGGSLLGSGVDVLDLGLTEDTVARLSASTRGVRVVQKGGDEHVGVAVGRLVDLGLVDDEEDL